MSIFRKCHIKLFLIIQVGDPCWLWLRFYSVFEFSPKSVLLYFGTTWARLEKCMIHYAHFFWEHLLYISQKKSKLWIWFSDFSDSRPKKIGFGAWGRFWQFYMSKKSSIYLQFCEFSINLVWSVIKVDRIYVLVNMALALFHKHL